MKYSSTFSALIAFLLCQSVNLAQNSAAILFDDPAFEANVREQLQWSGLEKDDPITQNHLDGITFLWLEGDGEDRVRNLDDLRYFTNLRSLEIWNASGISSFEPLWNLETINNLYIYGARKPDFSGMSALSALQILDLSDCSLQDLDFLVLRPISPNFSSYLGGELSRSEQRIEKFGSNSITRETNRRKPQNQN